MATHRSIVVALNPGSHVLFGVTLWTRLQGTSIHSGVKAVARTRGSMNSDMSAHPVDVTQANHGRHLDLGGQLNLEIRWPVGSR